MINPSSPLPENTETVLGMPDSGEPLVEPWFRQDGESTKWFIRFELYRQLGAGRSIWAAYREFRKRSGHEEQEARESARKRASVPKSWKEAAQRFNWTQRAEAYDLSEAQEQADEWGRRRDLFRQRQWDTASSILDKTAQMLVFPLQKTVRREDENGRQITEIHPTKWFLADVQRLAVAAQKLGQAAVGTVEPGAKGAQGVIVSSDELAAAAREAEEWEAETYGSSVPTALPTSDPKS
jgi:hypothetical protein